MNRRDRKMIVSRITLFLYFLSFAGCLTLLLLLPWFFFLVEEERKKLAMRRGPC